MTFVNLFLTISKINELFIVEIEIEHDFEKSFEHFFESKNFRYIFYQ